MSMPLIKMQVIAIMNTSAIASFPINWRVGFTFLESRLNWMRDIPIVLVMGANRAKNVTINARYLSSAHKDWTPEMIVTFCKPNKSGSTCPRTLNGNSTFSNKPTFKRGMNHEIGNRIISIKLPALKIDCNVASRCLCASPFWYHQETLMGKIKTEKTLASMMVTRKGDYHDD